MTRITCTFAGPSLSEEIVTKLEEQLGTTLPEDYRRFLLQTNGGVPDRSTFLLGPHPDDDLWWIDFFISIDSALAGPSEHFSDGYLSTLSHFNHLWGDLMPRDALPIARIVRDSFLLLVLHGESRGEVHMVSPMEVDDPSLDDVEKTRIVIAPSFSTFLTMLGPSKQP